MKKIIVFLLTFLLCAACVNVSALESTPDEALSGYDYVLGKVGNNTIGFYDVVYKAPENALDHYNSVVINHLCVYYKSDTMPIYLVNDKGEFELSSNLFENGLSDSELISIEKMVNESEYEAFKNKDVYVERLYEPTDPAGEEEPSTAAPGSQGDTEPDKPAPTDPRAEQDTQPEVPTTVPYTEAPGYTETDATVSTTAAATKVYPTYDPVIPYPTKPTATEQPITEKPEETSAPDSNKHSEKARAQSARVILSPELNVKTASLKCGKVLKLSVKNRNGKKVKFMTDNKSVAKVKVSGAVTTLKKGRAVITAVVGNKRLKCIVKVVSNPSLSKKSVKVKKNKKVTVKIYGKAPGFNNKYKNTKKAKIVSKKTASKIVVKGLKRGKTTLKVVVNKVTLKLKVKVK